MNEKDEVKENVDVAEQEKSEKITKEAGEFLRILSPFFNLLLLVFNMATDYDGMVTGVVNGALLVMSGLSYYYGKKLCGDKQYSGTGLLEAGTGGLVALGCILVMIFT